jgi:hypothetical protein
VKICGEHFNNKFISETGDEIPKEDCTKLLETLADPEDEDGFFPYTPFLVNYLYFNQKIVFKNNNEMSEVKIGKSYRKKILTYSYL